MERRRLAVILSHLSANTNQPKSWGDCGQMQSMNLHREVCGGKEGDANDTDEFGVCCRENVTGNSNSVVKAEEFSVEQGVGCNGRMYDAKEQCSETSKGVVRSHMTRSMEIVKEDQENCVFCDIVRGRAPALKLYEDETCLCILDINPLSHGHSLIIPKIHFSSLEVTPSAIGDKNSVSKRSRLLRKNKSSHCNICKWKSWRGDLHRPREQVESTTSTCNFCRV